MLCYWHYPIEGQTGFFNSEVDLLEKVAVLYYCTINTVRTVTTHVLVIRNTVPVTGSFRTVPKYRPTGLG